MYWKGFYGCSFPEAKASGKLAFGQLPILDIDGEHQIAQSGAQNRYVASLVKKPGFNPSAPAKVAFCDMIHETHQGAFYLHLLVQSMSFYPDFIQILSRFYPHFTLISSWFFRDSLYPTFIQISSWFHLNKIWI